MTEDNLVGNISVYTAITQCGFTALQKSFNASSSLLAV